MNKFIAFGVLVFSSAAFAQTFSCYRIWYRNGQATSYVATIVAETAAQANAINDQWQRQDPQNHRAAGCYPASGH